METRAALVAAGRDLFARQGYWLPTANQIAAQAELTRGALYHHFPEGKPDLFRAVFDTVQAEIHTLVAAAQASGAGWRGQLDAYLAAAARPEIARIVLTDAPTVLGPEAWRDADAALWMHVIEQGFATLPTGHPIHARNPHMAARLLFGALGEAALAVAGSENPDAARAEAIDTIAAMMGFDT